MAANASTSRDIGHDLRTHGHGTASIGLIVTSDQPLMAERELDFAGGATVQAGMPTAGTRYLFAYGSTGGHGPSQLPGDQAYLAIINPAMLGTATAQARVRCYDASGKLVGATDLTVPPGTRRTVDTAALARPRDPSGVYATVLTSSRPVVAEQSQYFGGNPNTPRHPGTALAGTPPGVTSVAFPNLNLSDRDVSHQLGYPQRQTVFLYNPGVTEITVTATYVAYTSTVNRATQTLTPVTKTVDYPVAAGSIARVAVNQDVASIITYRLGDGTFEDQVSATFTVSGPGASGGFAAAAITNSSYDGQTQVQQPIFPFTGTLGVALEGP